jgi:hypothetical protein
MRFKTMTLALLAVGFLMTGMSLDAQTEETQTTKEPSMITAKEKLVILWTSGDREVALKMVFMYTFNAKKNSWWKDITLIVWGPSAKLLSEDKELQEYMYKIMESGVEVRACKGCADQYGVSEKLQELGITVLYIGKELTDYIQEGRHVLTI